MIQREKNIPLQAFSEVNHGESSRLENGFHLSLLWDKDCRVLIFPVCTGVLEKGVFFFPGPEKFLMSLDFQRILVAVPFLKQVVIDQKFVFFRISEQTNKSKEAEFSRGHFLNFASQWLISQEQCISWKSQKPEKPKIKSPRKKTFALFQQERSNCWLLAEGESRLSWISAGAVCWKEAFR